MQHKSAIAVDWPTDMHRIARAETRRTYIQFLIQIAQIKVAGPFVDDQPHRRIAVMVAHQDH